MREEFPFTEGERMNEFVPKFFYEGKLLESKESSLLFHRTGFLSIESTGYKKRIPYCEKVKWAGKWVRVYMDREEGKSDTFFIEEKVNGVLERKPLTVEFPWLD